MCGSDTDHLPRIAGGIDAYEFYVWTVLYFRCDGCDASLDCPITEQDTEAPEGPWSTVARAKHIASAGMFLRFRRTVRLQCSLLPALHSNPRTHHSQ